MEMSHLELTWSNLKGFFFSNRFFVLARGLSGDGSFFILYHNNLVHLLHYHFGFDGNC